MEDNSDRLVEGVRAGALDLALIGAATATPDGLEALTIISERLVAVVPSGHPLAERQAISLRDLGAYPIVCMPPGTGLRTVFDRACAAQDLHPAIALQASAADAIATSPSGGLGVAVLSESMAAPPRDRLTALPRPTSRRPLCSPWCGRAPTAPRCVSSSGTAGAPSQVQALPIGPTARPRHELRDRSAR
ncbi:hypothetical protein GCM10020219_076020 [Nonomuraea dietziae]